MLHHCPTTLALFATSHCWHIHEKRPSVQSGFFGKKYHHPKSSEHVRAKLRYWCIEYFHQFLSDCRTVKSIEGSDKERIDRRDSVVEEEIMWWLYHYRSLYHHLSSRFRFEVAAIFSLSLSCEYFYHSTGRCNTHSSRAGLLSFPFVSGSRIFNFVIWLHANFPLFLFSFYAIVCGQALF